MFPVVRDVVGFFLLLINGKAKITNKDRIPKDENFILVAPHRTFFDPVYLAIGARPKKFIFMAKEELFKNKLFAWFIRKLGAFPVNRAKPGPSVIKYPVKRLKQDDVSLVMFPTGTRHATDLKGGVSLIAKMARVRIVPAVYQGPLSIGGLFKRKKTYVNFGEPIDVSDIVKMDEEGMNEVSRRIQAAFDFLDKEINPDYVYIPKKKKEEEENAR
ncbi:MAG: 1-acyl-sn-glycerol-3-phosphate acyltransferase [Streptococcaceae bacterium]|nr:1-acyl-sn-glycerol-3-phosphate acyltransferase [Streptococcaceae bacterium]